jgi:hypothetical protein
MKGGCFLKKVIFSLIVFLLGTVFAVYGQTGSPELPKIESADVIPSDMPQIEGIFIVSPGLEFGLGNVNADDYSLLGTNGQGYLKTSLDLIKSFGPVFLMGHVADSVGLAEDNSYNLFEANLTPLVFLGPLIVGAQFSGMFPFYEGRLVETVLQMPEKTPFMAIANFGIAPGIGSMLPFEWGMLYGSFLLPLNKFLSTDDWSVQGNLQIGISTAFGFGAALGPNFAFINMGEKAEDTFNSFNVQLSYFNMEIPLSAMVAFSFPGSQKDGFKNYGMLIGFNVHTFFDINEFQIPKWDLWFGMDLINVGNSVGTKVVVTPKVGLTYMISSIKTAETADSSAADGSADFSAPNENDSAPLAEPPHWYIGLASGYTNNSLYTSTAGRPFTEYNNGHGFEIAVPVRYQFNSWFAIQGEIQYIQKNYVWQRTGEYDRIKSSVRNSFLDFPFMLNFSLGNEKLRAFTNLGAYAGIWIRSHRKGTLAENTIDPYNPGAVYYHDFDEKAEFDKRRDARFDGGLLAGLGVQYAFNPCSVFIEGRYYYGLTDLQQNYSNQLTPRMNSTFNIRLGVLFNSDIFQLFRKGN